MFVFSYDKTEGLVPGSPAMLNHTHLILEAGSDEDEALQPYRNTFTIVDRVYKNSFKFVGLKFPPVEVVPKPVIYILEKNIKSVKK